MFFTLKDTMKMVPYGTKRDPSMTLLEEHFVMANLFKTEPDKVSKSTDLKSNSSNPYFTQQVKMAQIFFLYTLNIFHSDFGHFNRYVWQSHQNSQIKIHATFASRRWKTSV